MISARYRVVGPIGAGGMGIVVKALRLTDGRAVAIKFLQPGAYHHWDRFVREAAAARLLDSPHITRVLDVDGLSATPPYIVFELLEGETLAEISARLGRLPVNEVIHLSLQTCDALRAAHERGIIHRDIKPSNLFVLNVGGMSFLKVLDFGISKLETESGHDVALTTTSTVIGSPSYASPEQLARPRSVDHRTDIWSLGVTIYTLLSGEVPFPGETAPEVHSKVLGATPPPVSVHVPGLPHGLDAIVQRCLAKDPRERFQTVAELSAALQRLGSATQPRSATSPRSRRIAGLAVLFVSAAAVAITAALSRGARPHEPDRPRAASTATTMPPSTLVAAPGANVVSVNTSSTSTGQLDGTPALQARVTSPPQPSTSARARGNPKPTRISPDVRAAPVVVDPADHR